MDQRWPERDDRAQLQGRLRRALELEAEATTAAERQHYQAAVAELQQRLAQTPARSQRMLL